MRTVRPARILALTVSAVLGVAVGVVAGMVPDTHPRAHSSYQDPLGLGAPMVNQPCNGRVLLLLASSDNPNGLGPELSANSDARYLETADSCDTAWAPRGEATHAYVVYQGPYRLRAGCAMRMTGEHRNDSVTQLTAKTPELVRCLCFVSYRDAPMLPMGANLDDFEIVYLHSLQNLLTAMGRRGDIPTTEHYDQRTVSEVKRFQRYVGRPATGKLFPLTWKDLQNRGCKLS